MKSAFYISVLCVLTVAANAQEKNFDFRFYLKPAVARSVTTITEFDGNTVLSKSKTSSLNFAMGAGVEGLLRISDDWAAGLDMGFTRKGYVGVERIQSGRGSGVAGMRTSFLITFFETMLFAEKQIPIDDYEILTSGGFFYGKKGTPVVSFIDLSGNDFGGALGVGFRKDRFYAKLDFRQGFVALRSTEDFSMRSTLIGVKLGMHF